MGAWGCKFCVSCNGSHWVGWVALSCKGWVIILTLSPILELSANQRPLSHVNLIFLVTPSPSLPLNFLWILRRPSYPYKPYTPDIPNYLADSRELPLSQNAAKRWGQKKRGGSIFQVVHHHQIMHYSTKPCNSIQYRVLTNKWWDGALCSGGAPKCPGASLLFLFQVDIGMIIEIK